MEETTQGLFQHLWTMAAHGDPLFYGILIGMLGVVLAGFLISRRKPGTQDRFHHEPPAALERREPSIAIPAAPKPLEPQPMPQVSTAQTPPSITPAPPPPVETPPLEIPPPTQVGRLSRLRNGLSKTRANFTEGLSSLVLGSKQIDESLLEEIETRLLMADVGIDATQRIAKTLTLRLNRHELRSGEAVMSALAHDMQALLAPCEKPLVIPPDVRPFVILMVGINGAGKTTTIGKLAHRFKSEGLKVMLAAGDTFRAAAVEQLQTWGVRNDVPVIAQHSGADSASVIYDAVEAAKARQVDVLIADTAGRLHTQTNLMQELAKIRRVMSKIDPNAPHEVMLVVDGGTGQNALAQARQFNESVPLTGITITKLDGTAKGGILFAIASQLEIPIRFIGVGEGIEDLRVFNAEDFVTALLEQPEAKPEVTLH